METKPKIVFVFSKQSSEQSTRYSGFARRLQKAGGLEECDVLTVALENLVYLINENGEAKVYDSVSQFDLANASMVYLKSWQSLPNESAALARYLFHKGVLFADTLSLGKGTSKLVTLFRQWGGGIRIPNTVYTTKNETLAQLLDTDEIRNLLGDRFILKDTEGAKGKLNFFVDAQEAKQIITEYPDVRFICQRFIVNDGDYRVGVYGETASFLLKRVGSGSSHLNNVSAGGTGTYLPIDKAPKKLLALAEKAAQISELQIAGVDVIQDKETGRWYILEVNQGSQVVTGAFTDENMTAFNKGLVAMLKNRHVRSRQLPMKMIGRRAIAKLSDLGVERAVAKIDTGAYSSTLHAENIVVSTDDKGVPVLSFDVVPGAMLTTSTGELQTVKTTDFFDQKVRSSNGQVQHRYSIKTKITIEGRRFPVVLTLSDRSAMGYPLLIGRRVLRSRFMVNVELDENNKVEWKF